MKEFIKKFKNFKLVALLEMIFGGVGVLAALVLLILYQTNTYISETESAVGFYNQPFPGMVFFLAGLISIILGVVVVYSAIPFIFSKEKRDPNRFLPWFGVAQAAFSLVQTIFAFIMISQENSRHSVLVIIFSILLIASLVPELLMIYPTIKNRFIKE